MPFCHWFSSVPLLTFSFSPTGLFKDMKQSYWGINTALCLGVTVSYLSQFISKLSLPSGFLQFFHWFLAGLIVFFSLCLMRSIGVLQRNNAIIGQSKPEPALSGGWNQANSSLMSDFLKWNMSREYFSRALWDSSLKYNHCSFIRKTNSRIYRCRVTTSNIYRYLRHLSSEA